MAATGEGNGSQDDQLFRGLQGYSWDSDQEFQAGLIAILGPDPLPEQVENLTLRARCFYYSRKFNVPVDFTAYQQWHSQYVSKSNTAVETTSATDAPSTSNTVEASSQPAGGDSESKPPYPMSFNHIVELITTGQPIPGIKEIPETVLEGQSSQAITARRKKPWEKDEE